MRAGRSEVGLHAPVGGRPARRITQDVEGIVSAVGADSALPIKVAGVHAFGPIVFAGGDGDDVFRRARRADVAARAVVACCEDEQHFLIAGHQWLRVACERVVLLRRRVVSVRAVAPTVI